MSLATIRETPGLDTYLDDLEVRLAAAVDSHPGLASEVGREALSAGGKRLRPLLVFLASRPGEAPLAAGAAVELVHMATLVHDDLIDQAHYRRGREAAWASHGPGAARAAGDYLFARAFAELAETGDRAAVQCLAGATLALARGEALQRAQTHDPDTSVDDYLARCALKTGKLFEAACLLGSGGDKGLGRFGLALGIAFQIADDILDCSGETIETGKIAGTDLREGTPTLPLILAAREDASVRLALAGGPLDGALVRVAETGALEVSRELALDYARRARACLDGHGRRDELDRVDRALGRDAQPRQEAQPVGVPRVFDRGDRRQVELAGEQARVQLGRHALNLLDLSLEPVEDRRHVHVRDAPEANHAHDSRSTTASVRASSSSRQG